MRGDVADAPVRQMVRWMMAARKDGRWGNTQENAMAMEALVAYYRKFEAASPDFRAVVKIGAEDFARETFKGRSTTATSKDLPMAKVLATGEAGANKPLTFSREGTGTLFYTARLRYAADELYQEGQNSGIDIERSYAPYAESGIRPPSLTLQGRRSGARDADVQPDQGAALRGRDRSAAGGLRGGRVLVRDDGGVARAHVDRPRRATAEAGSPGGSAVGSITSNVSTIACSSSPPASARASTSSPTSSARRRPGSFRTAPARAEEMYEPEVFGRTRRRT